ncbi:HEAT repeat domain-containing protein [Tychonema sp. LEGE 07203]|uniref:HEAT repeat domain-containing protein n=1 Tax=Tychonema sp. LEGE 07203 TaxID=1828671 RepID=UPI001880EC37|nr:HEAT repeat domain-containing protein [Tychonema sp. LEGE 07203]
MGIIGAIVGFLTGVAVAYSLLEKRLKKQKQEHLQQTRRIAQDIELAQISRMQQNAGSQGTEGEDRPRQSTVEHETLLRQVTTQYENQLQQVAAQYENQLQQIVAERDRLQQVAGAHENQLRQQVSQELEAAHNAKLQENLQSLQAEHEHHLLRVADELHHNYQAQIEEHLQNLQNEHEIRLRQTVEEYENREVEMQLSMQALQEQYESQLQAANEQLQAHEAQMQATIMSLQQQYENNLQQQEVPPPQLGELNQTEVGEYLPQPEVWQEQSSELNQTAVEQDLNYTDYSEPQSIDLEQQAEVEQQPQTARQSATHSVAQLMGLVQSQDTETRKFAASAFGQMAAANALRTDTQRVIETLGKLAEDFQPEVREAAVEALAMIKSEKVIPLLEKALRDTDSAVAVAASAAINKFKFYPPAEDEKPKIIDIKKPNP